jgi:ribulose-5-phosphate 4-epimerase/fuculose-1-phosphate aldolase
MIACAPSMMDEGVIKFSADHRDAPAFRDRIGDLACALSAWREILTQIGLVGQDPGRYGGAGYGNVSGRVGPYPGERGGRTFLVTGTQTGGKRTLGLDDFCLVERYDDRRNWVRSAGPCLPSSESLTHGAIYDLSARIRFVFHGHCPVIWNQAARLHLPTTAASVAYGTPEMARQMRRLYRETSLPEARVLSMAGHEDGIIAFGESVEEAGSTLVTILARAYQRICMG